MAIKISGTTVIDDSRNLININSGLGVGIQSAGSVIGSGITTLNFVGTGNTFAVSGGTVNISIAGGGGGGGSGGGGGDFNTGITSITTANLTGTGSIVLTLPPTVGQQYIIRSINVANVAVGNTEVNVIGAFDFTTGQRSYFAYNIPIPTGTSVELLKQPQILNPSDIIVMRSTDYTRIGSDNIVQVYISYEPKTSTNYFGVGLGTVGIAVTTPVGVYTSTTYPSVLQSIRLVNTTDSGAYPVSVTVTSGVNTTYLVEDLLVPKYASVELLDNPKAIKTNDVVSVIVEQPSTIDVQVSGIKVV